MNAPAVTASDLTWTADDGVFKYRVAALIHRGDDILVCEMDELDYAFVPGGKVRMGESTKTALEREVTEELGRCLPVARLALVVENLWRNGTLKQEVCFYYEVLWPDDVPPEAVNDTVEPGHRFTWVPLDQLAEARFQPAELLPYLTLEDGIRHVVMDRR